MLRPFVLAVLLTGCADLRRALAPAPRPWPAPADDRVRIEGRMVRAYGASLKSREDADAEARRAMERWLLRLDLDAELLERRPLVRSVLDAPHARPVPSPALQAAGYSSVISLDLATLQKNLGTRYDFPPVEP
ncbi:MAG: hypothetical protein SF051_02925 [Elusimicrobiota bacterium]|nr:hypothetical protein [Elusimicrobiota bacterium]